MSQPNPSTFLRRVLVVDAAISAAAGFAMALGASVLEDALGLPRALLTWAGLSLFPFAAYLLFVATRELSSTTIGAIVAANAAWVAASVLLLTSGWVEPTTLGYAFVIIQAVAVAVLGEIEWFGLRRSAAAPAGAQG